MNTCAHAPSNQRDAVSMPRPPGKPNTDRIHNAVRCWFEEGSVLEEHHFLSLALHLRSAALEPTITFA